MTVKDMMIEMIESANCDYVIYDDGSIECDTVTGETMLFEFDNEGRLKNLLQKRLDKPLIKCYNKYVS